MKASVALRLIGLLQVDQSWERRRLRDEPQLYLHRTCLSLQLWQPVLVRMVVADSD